jgi:hypothetical protein
MAHEGVAKVRVVLAQVGRLAAYHVALILECDDRA